MRVFKADGKTPGSNWELHVILARLSLGEGCRIPAEEGKRVEIGGKTGGQGVSLEVDGRLREAEDGIRETRVVLSHNADRKSVGWGKRGDLGGARIIKKKNHNYTYTNRSTTAAYCDPHSSSYIHNCHNLS